MIAKNLKYTILLFFVILIIFYIARPPLFYNQTTVKKFGLGKNKILITPLHISLVVALFYYMILNIEYPHNI